MFQTVQKIEAFDVQ